MSTASITFWRRFEPRPRENDLKPSFAAEIRDPAWFLARQWQLAEFRGEDAASPAYVEYFGKVSKLPRWAPGRNDGTERDVDTGVPLERQTLSEPIEPDHALQVELSQTFQFLLEQRVGPTLAHDMFGAFATNSYALVKLDDPPPVFRPFDAGSRRFVDVCLGRSLDGYALYQLAKDLRSGQGRTIPTDVTNLETESGQVAETLSKFLDHATAVFGEIATRDPDAWQFKRLEYGLRVVAVDPGEDGTKTATLAATPNDDGEYDWTSFDVVDHGSNPTEPPDNGPKPRRFTMIPTDVRFPGIPNPRHWYFEKNSVSFVDVLPDPADIPKVVVVDMMLTHGTDWYLLPFEQEVGTAVRTDALVVTDVFGKRMLVTRAEKNDNADHSTMPAPSPGRWTMFSTTDRSDGTEGLADYFVLPLSAGPVAQDGRVLEDVRFGRDEMANMAWAIERVTESAIGEARSGRERDADIAAGEQPPAPAPGDPDAPLRYLIETFVPANWIPLLGVQVDSEKSDGAADRTFVLEKAAMVRLRPSDGVPDIVPSIGRFLAPTALPQPPYQIVEEEVSRSGLRLERTVSRTRWIDGTTHLWVSRRRHAGAGESQSGLRFDQALPNR
jgi:hypothetical protein